MITQILLQQTIIMFALMLLGLLLSRRGMITEQGSRDLSNVLLYADHPGASFCAAICLNSARKSCARWVFPL